MFSSARRLAVRVDKFRRLPSGERRLLLQAIGWIVAVRIGLWSMPRVRFLRIIETGAIADAGSATQIASPTRIAWAVSNASRLVPRTGGDLALALTTCWILRRNGYPAELRFLDDLSRSEPRPSLWAEIRGDAIIAEREMKRLERSRARRTKGLDSGPETDLLLLCAKHGLPGQDPKPLAALLGARLDWGQVERLAKSHKLLPFLYGAIAESPSETPPADVRSRILRDYQRHVERTRKRVAELARVLRLFDENEIRVIPFKGPVLAISAYGNVLSRKFGDLDLLVDRVDYGRSEALLVDQGYRPTKRFAWEVALRLYSEEIVVDLHHGMAQRIFAIPIDFEELWGRSSPIHVGTIETRRLSSHDLFLFLSVKLMNDWVEGRCELGRIRDIAQLLHTDDEIRWELLLADARRRGAERLVLVTLELTHLTLDVPLPAFVRERIDALDGVPQLAKRAADELFKPEASLSYADRLRLYTAQRERSADRCAIHFDFTLRRLKAWVVGIWQDRTIDA